MSNLVEFARKELERRGLFREDSDYDGMLGNAVLGLVQLFAAQGHSGFSATRAIQIFSKVAAFEPLTPLTGADDEWTCIGPDKYQNNRCSHVFKENGQAYDINGKVFRTPNGGCWLGPNSRVDVTFPYVPHTEYVDVSEV